MWQYSTIILHMRYYCTWKNAGDTDIAHCKNCKVAIILKYYILPWATLFSNTMFSADVTRHTESHNFML